MAEAVQIGLGSSSWRLSSFVLRRLGFEEVVGGFRRVEALFCTRCEGVAGDLLRGGCLRADTLVLLDDEAVRFDRLLGSVSKERRFAECILRNQRVSPELNIKHPTTKIQLRKEDTSSAMLRSTLGVT